VGARGVRWPKQCMHIWINEKLKKLKYIKLKLKSLEFDRSNYF
jgi:hypothetical protein